MLKAFTKVFHKSQGPNDEQLASGTPNSQQQPEKPALKRTIERRHPSASSKDAAGVLGLTSPRRNAAEVGSAHAQAQALGAATSPAKRTSVLQRSEQHPLQPRLHLKGPAPGVDGRFALTADNIEWHLRLIPPMKESKYDWIVRYVQEQQQNVAAAATESSQHQRDIESSMLMTGQMHYEYVGPNYLDHRAAAQQQQHQQQLQFQMMHAQVQSRNLVGSNHVSAPLPQQQLLPPIQHSLTNTTNKTANGQREADMLSPDNEEDDNMPLAAINAGTSPRHQPTLPLLQPTAANIGHTSCMDKYVTGSLNDPLPEPVSPSKGARLSLMSFQSNVAVNMDTPGARAVSRSHSMSNPLSPSALEPSHSVTKVENLPPARDSSPPMIAGNPTSARQLSCPIPVGNTMSGFKQLQKCANASDDEGDDEPLATRRSLKGNVTPGAGVRLNARTLTIQSNPVVRAASDAESDSAPALRVVNQASSHDSDESADGRDIGDAQVVPRTPLLASGGVGGDDDEEDDDMPLMRLNEKNAQRPPPLLNVNTSIARPPIPSYNCNHSGLDDDDNRPLSSLMLLAHSADDDLSSSLPLPMPRHVIDPDAVVNISDIINESVTPPRTSLSERPTSPLISTGSTRKHSLLLRSFHPGAQGSETTGRAVAGANEAIGEVIGEHDDGALFARDSADSSVSSKRRQDTNRALAMLESGQANGDSSKRPWAMNHARSTSAVSLASSRRAPRGSTLGQQLTDELHMLREDLARSRREHEKAERRSWQVGDPAAVQQPWVRHENTMSDTALPQKLNSLRADSANDLGDGADDVDKHSKVTLPWLHSNKQRPMSTQQLHTSKWFGMGGSSSRVFHGRQQSRDDVADVQQPASPQSVHVTSLSTRIGNKLGKLKQSFKHGSGA
ncbi:hypothetical protein IWW38_001147 [Coemansia aciculifera]|uniref:Uncharacterized protein n=1 Tax=Coemansia aciculifera TaxID=417176 RepID=A0ACC1M8W3_9FUNG|nr:hypothetical protein IWW38_001147 [Coemansia aciculifera]